MRDRRARTVSRRGMSSPIATEVHQARWAMRNWGRHAANVFLILYVVISLVPLVWLFITSLKYQVDMFAYPPKVVFSPTLEHYVSVLTKSSFPRYVRNSLLSGGLATAASLVIGSLCAYGLARFNFRGKAGILLWVLIVRLIPPLALVIPFYMLLRTLGLYDTVIGLGIIYLTLNLPLTVWLMTTYFSEVPAEVEGGAGGRV